MNRTILFTIVILAIGQHAHSQGIDFNVKPRNEAVGDIERTYELASLKYIYTVNLKITGRRVSGTPTCNEYGDIREKVDFAGITDGKTLRIKFAKRPNHISLVKPDNEGFHTLRREIQGEAEKLFIPIYGRYDPDSDSHPVYDMPLDEKKE
jgi:hypothetical protein